VTSVVSNVESQGGVYGEQGSGVCEGRVVFQFPEFRGGADEKMRRKGSSCS
jgi:hypothetical protein